MLNIFSTWPKYKIPLLGPVVPEEHIFIAASLTPSTRTGLQIEQKIYFYLSQCSSMFKDKLPDYLKLFSVPVFLKSASTRSESPFFPFSVKIFALHPASERLSRTIP